MWAKIKNKKMHIIKHGDSVQQEIFKKNGYIHPKEFQKGIYKKMDAFFSLNIKNDLPIEIAIDNIKRDMLQLFPARYISWFFSLYEPFPTWTPLYGWMALARSLCDTKSKD